MKIHSPTARTLIAAAAGLLAAVLITILVEMATGTSVLLPGTPSGAGSGLVKGGVETPTPDSPTKPKVANEVIGPNGRVVSKVEEAGKGSGKAAAAPASSGQGKDD